MRAANIVARLLQQRILDALGDATASAVELRQWHERHRRTDACKHGRCELCELATIIGEPANVGTDGTGIIRRLRKLQADCRGAGRQSKARARLLAS